MSSSRVDRRSFLSGSLASVPLIGTLSAAGSHRPTAVPALRGSHNSVVIPTHEWAGLREERLDFPSDWKVDVLGMAGHSTLPLTEGEIAAKLGQPIGTRSLRDLAIGKQRVVITFDDLLRSTPAYAVAPWVVGELQAAGVKDERILFLAATGTHRPMSAADIQSKLGPQIAQRYAWTSHNCFDNLKDLGETSFKNKIRLNQTFLAADLKVCIGGVKIHGFAGYGGGAKSILPGVAALTTIEYNHAVILSHNATAGPARVFKNQTRLDMNEAARMAGVDFSVQVVYNQKLEATAVFSGDVVDAHSAAARVAVQHYRTKTFQNADVVVSNAYPMCGEAESYGVPWIPRSLKEGGTGVLIVQHPLGQDPVHYLHNREAGRNGASYFDLTARRLHGNYRGMPANAGLIVYSQYTDRSQMNNYPQGSYFCEHWADVIKILQQRHKGTVQVAVYPYAGIQQQEIDLDG